MAWDEGLGRATLGEFNNQNLNANQAEWKRTTVVKEKTFDSSKPKLLDTLPVSETEEVKKDSSQ